MASGQIPYFTPDDSELSFGNALIGFGSQLMTPRSQGGGVGPAFQEMQRQAYIQQQIARQRVQDERQAKLYEQQLESGRMQLELAKDAARRRAALSESVGAIWNGGGAPSPAAPGASPVTPQPAAAPPSIGMSMPNQATPPAGSTLMPGQQSFGIGQDEPVVEPPTEGQQFQFRTQSPKFASMIGGPAASAKAETANKLLKTGAVLIASGEMDDGLKMIKEAGALMPEVFKIEEAMKNGQRVFVTFFKDNTMSVSTDVTPIPDIDWSNENDQFRLGVDKVTGQPVARIALTPDPIKLAAQRTAEGQLRVSQGNLGVAQGNLAQRKAELAALERDRVREADIKRLAATGDTRKAATDLRKEFTALKEVNAYKSVVPVVNSAYQAADTTSGDLNIIYAFAKTMDPESVVREGETALVIKSGSPAQQIMGLWNFVAEGKGRIPPEQRAQLMREITVRAQQYEAPYRASRSAYEGIARRNNVPVEDIFVGLPSLARMPASANVTGPNTAAGMIAPAPGADQGASMPVPPPAPSWNQRGFSAPRPVK